MSQQFSRKSRLVGRFHDLSRTLDMNQREGPCRYSHSMSTHVLHCYLHTRMNVSCVS